MKIDKISINGQIFESSRAKISALDHALVFGVSVFETFRVSSGEVFLLDEHLARLKRSLEYLSIKNVKFEGLLQQLKTFIDDFDVHDDLFIRLMVTAGSSDLKLSQQQYVNSNILIYGSKISEFKPVEKQAKIIDSVNRSLPEYYPITKVRLKTSDYLSAGLAQVELDNYKKINNMHEHIEGILLTQEGYVAEALTSNIFWVKDGKFFTPPLSLGILPGIIRSFIIENEEVEEKLIKTNDLMSADEIFLTNSVNFICPLNKINDKILPGINGRAFVKIDADLLS